jgi:hypothetical protein
MQILELIASTSDEILMSLEKDAEHPNVSALRRLESYCSKQFLLSRDKRECFLCFFVLCFINDVFYNLAGDTPYYGELHRERVSMFREVAEHFSAIKGKTLANSDDFQGVVQILSDLVSIYARKINLLNRQSKHITEGPNVL